MEDSRPIIYYIDDEPFNLTVFETMVPEEWNTKTFANPLKALEELMEDKPWVVLSDQKMPGTSGVKFLEMVKNLTPNAIRIIVTGFSDENLVVDSVRKACIYDYIKKPWNEDDFLASLNRAIDHHKKVEETKRLQAELAAKNRELEEKAIALKKIVQQEVENSSILHNSIHLQQILTVYRLCQFIDISPQYCGERHIFNDLNAYTCPVFY